MATGTSKRPAKRVAARRGRVRGKDPLDASLARDQRVEDAIVEASVKCFSRFGIRKSSMEDIADAAQLSRPTLYRYFPSRSHLILEVLIREVRDHTRLVVPVIRRHAYPPRALIEGILFDIASAREHPYTAIIVSEAGSEMLSKIEGSDRVLLDAMSEQWLPSLTRWREDGYLRADLRMDDVLRWITLFIHSVLVPRWIGIPDEDIRRTLAGLIVPGLFDLERLRRDFPGETLTKLADPVRR